MAFNHDPLKKNIVRSSVTAWICWAVTVALTFGYRAVFLRILTVEYLGINGLFANILSMLSLAELGISDAIIYRLYKPISTDSTVRVRDLIGFFKSTYRLIALVILLAGCAVCPFLKTLIRDSGEIPEDVNVYVVFLLLLVQTSATYLFSYKFSLLDADQKKNQTHIIRLINTVARTSLQLLTLVLTKDYTLSLAVGIVATVAADWLAGRWVTAQYPNVFEQAEKLSKEEKKQIYKDTSAALLHKIGGTVVSSTDNILLSKFIGLAVTGLYSNYQMVISGLTSMIGAILSAFTPSLGNAHATMRDSERYAIYRKTLFFNFWIAGISACCLYVLLDDFILLWLKDALFLDHRTKIALCALFYMQTVRMASAFYTLSCGLFKRDRFRPVIESILNIAISIVCLKRIGTAGIFMGTILSNLVTVFWREPYLLYRYAFHQKLRDFWKWYVLNLLVTAAAVLLSLKLKTLLFGEQLSLAAWIAAGLICIFVFAALHSLVFFRANEYRYFVRLLYRHTAKRRFRG